jgi:hypothetical protein
VKRLVLILCSLVLVLVGGLSFGQDKTLAVTTNATVVDGVVNPDEYSFSQDFGKLALYVNRTADALYIGAVGVTTGWVAVGLGSLRMDGSTIFMGFVGADGKVQFKTQAGKGHQHMDADTTVADTIISYAMKEAGGKTTLEIALKPTAYITQGQASLDLIWAEGAEDSFTPRHMSRGALSLTLAQ